jgi:hypothetical protein
MCRQSFATTVVVRFQAKIEVSMNLATVYIAKYQEIHVSGP